jgi:hypothetical protein
VDGAGDGDLMGGAGVPPAGSMGSTICGVIMNTKTSVIAKDVDTAGVHWLPVGPAASMQTT